MEAPGKEPSLMGELRREWFHVETTFYFLAKVRNLGSRSNPGNYWPGTIRNFPGSWRE